MAPAPARPAVNAALKKQKAPRPPARSGGGGGAIVVAVLALLVALGSAAVAVYALDEARDAKSRAAATAVNPQPPTAPPAEIQPTVTPTPTPSPTPEFIADRVGVSLVVAVAPGCPSSFVDVDTMQTGVDAGHDFYLTNCLGPQVIQVDRAQAAASTSQNATAAACASQLAGLTGGQELTVNVSQGATFCLLTSKLDASNGGIPQRLAIVEVMAVGTTEGTVTLRISTYRVPSSA